MDRDASQSAQSPAAPSAVPLLVLNRQQAAQALGISVRLLDDLVRCGELPHTRLGGRVVFPVAALTEHLSEQAMRGAGK